MRICASAPSLFASVSVSEVLGCGESLCRSQWDFDGPRRVFTHNSFECVSQFLCSQPCHPHLITFPTHSRWLKISSWRKNALQEMTHIPQHIVLSEFTAAHVYGARSSQQLECPKKVLCQEAVVRRCSGKHTQCCTARVERKSGRVR